MRFLSWCWNNFEEFVGGICLALMTIVTCVNILLRYVFNAPIIWASEVTLILFVWMIMFGMGAAARRNLHPKIEAVHWFVSEKKRIYIEWMVQVVVIIFLAVMVVLSWDFSWNLGMQKLTGFLQLRYTFIYVSMPLGFGFLCLRVCTQFILSIKSLYDKRTPVNQEVSIVKEVV
ncbi:MULTISPECIES: TRAP transporter small permease [unclassified Paenibacillus]|uniref:TRAP transporter small permease n=1 Tax=unclassified Paenibacillus TaxID=185978 RepID=UPI003628D361